MLVFKNNVSHHKNYKYPPVATEKQEQNPSTEKQTTYLILHVVVCGVESRGSQEK